MESSCRAFERHAHFVIVPVRIFALALIAAQGVPCGEGFVHADFKHLRASCRCESRKDWP